jgi:hypothetical protein
MDHLMNWLGCLCVFVLLSLAFTAAETVYAQNLNSGLIIPDSEIHQVELQALKGSGEAARKLTNHYEFGVYYPKKAAYWAQIGAENRDPVSEWNYGNLLQEDPDPLAQIRATYWHDRAKKDGVDLLAAPAQNPKPKSK